MWVWPLLWWRSGQRQLENQPRRHLLHRESCESSSAKRFFSLEQIYSTSMGRLCGRMVSRPVKQSNPSMISVLSEFFPAGRPHCTEIAKQHQGQSSMVGNQKACKKSRSQLQNAMPLFTSSPTLQHRRTQPRRGRGRGLAAHPPNRWKGNLWGHSPCRWLHPAHHGGPGIRTRSTVPATWPHCSLPRGPQTSPFLPELQKMRRIGLDWFATFFSDTIFLVKKGGDNSVF